MHVDDLPDDVMERIVKSLDNINALVNFNATTKNRRLKVAPNATFSVELLQGLFERNLQKLPKPIKEVMSTMPNLQSLKVTRFFWKDYIGSLFKAGLVDGTFAEAWDTAYKMHATFFEDTQDRPNRPRGASYYWDDGQGDRFLTLHALP